jgi:hypothetical protein
MSLRPAFAEACPNGTRVGDRRLIQLTDGSAEPGLRHVARGAGFVPHHRELVIVEDQLAEQYDLLKAIQRCQSCVVDRFSFDAVDLKFDSLDLLLGCGRNLAPAFWVFSLSGMKRGRRGDEDHRYGCQKRVSHAETSSYAACSISLPSISALPQCVQDVITLGVRERNRPGGYRRLCWECRQLQNIPAGYDHRPFDKICSSRMFPGHG